MDSAHCVLLGGFVCLYYSKHLKNNRLVLIRNLLLPFSYSIGVLFLVTIGLYTLFVPYAKWKYSQIVKKDHDYAQQKGISYEELILRRKKRQKISKKQRREIYKRDHHQCRNCGSTESLTIDHIFPIFRGGGNEAENLQLLCAACNNAKSDSVV